MCANNCNYLLRIYIIVLPKDILQFNQSNGQDYIAAVARI
jgi:hypothetical protein